VQKIALSLAISLRPWTERYNKLFLTHLLSYHDVSLIYIKSAITKTTEEISVMISGGGESTKSEVELTFLRYIGPIRPVRDEEPTSKTPSSVPAPKPSSTMIVSTTPDESEEVGQELVIASNREIKISKRLSKKSPEKTTGLEEKHPAPILVSPKAQKSRNPFARIFKRNKSKKKQFTA